MLIVAAVHTPMKEEREAGEEEEEEDEGEGQTGHI
jgi:hypothetical protein